MHRLLERQLRICGFDSEMDEKTERLVESVNKMYHHFTKEIEVLDSNTTNMLKKMSSYNENLENIIESIDGFSYHVSHDLKTSVINNISLTKMLKKYYEKGDASKMLELMGLIEKNSSTGLRIIEKYLEISKFESNIEESVKESLTVSNLVSQILEEVSLQDKIDIEINPSGLDTVFIDEISLRSILQNFITNAFKYKDPSRSPKIEILIKKDQDHQIISFKDNCIGMDMEKDGKKIFKPFTRLSHVDVHGDGVGLFIVKKIITRLKGSIKVESEIGVGTTFTIGLPNY